MPTPIARWNPARSVWETNETLICGHSDVWSETWPSSGMWADGQVYALPTSAPPTDGSVSSLLRTPTAQLAINGGSQHPDKRKAGGHGPTLADEVEHLLPLPPAATTPAGASVADGAPILLPTPTAMDSKASGGSTPSDVTLTDAVVRTDLGKKTNTRHKER